MTNLVLYRKYRPQSFAEIVGQEHIVKTLSNAISLENISHAYLFSGPRGSGKTSIARLFAKAINCQDKSSFEPCNKCESCLEISSGKSIDLVEIDAASHTGVDDVRELIDGTKFAPVKSKYKIFIIDECHQLSKSASNALLKTLEEPPSHVVFLLATTDVHKMIPTIISRCQRFDFKRSQNQEIIKKLEFIAKKEGVKIDDSALALLAANSRGSFRDAETLFDQVISFCGQDKKIETQEIKDLLGIVETSQVSMFLDFVLQKQAKEAILFLNSLVDSGIDLQEFAKAIIYYLRQAMILKIDEKLLNTQTSGLSLQEIEKIKKQIENLNQKDIQKFLETFIQAEGKIKYNSIPQLPLELAIVELVD